MDKRLKMAYLYDIYCGLLTDKQQSILDLYYNDDLSLSEIAQEEGVSRQAAFDLIKRAESLMEKYETGLKLFEKYIENEEIIERVLAFESVKGDEQLSALLKKLKDNL